MVLSGVFVDRRWYRSVEDAQHGSSEIIMGEKGKEGRERVSERERESRFMRNEQACRSDPLPRAR